MTDSLSNRSGFGKWLRLLVAAVAIISSVRLVSQWLTLDSTAEFVAWLRPGWVGELMFALVLAIVLVLQSDFRARAEAIDATEARFSHVFRREFAVALPFLAFLILFGVWVGSHNIAGFFLELRSTWLFFALIPVAAGGLALWDANRRWLGPGYAERGREEGGYG